MSSRAGSETARLRRVRRLAQRQGMSILEVKKYKEKATPGGLMLSEDSTRRVVLGDRPKPFSATLEQLEDYFSGEAHEE